MAPLGALAGVSLLTQPAASVAAPVTWTATTPILHVVIVYQENHSFDNVMSQFCAAHPGRGCSGPTIGSVVTMADGAHVTISAEPDIVPRVRHTPQANQYAVANQWDRIPGCTANQAYACIEAVPANEVQNLYAAASSGAIATNVFQFRQTASWAAHFELVSPTNDGFIGTNPTGAIGGGRARTGGCRVKVDAYWKDSAGNVSLQPACIPDYSVNPAAFPAGWPTNAGGAYRATMVPHVPNLWSDRLDPAGIPWAEYITDGSSNNDIWDICADFAACIYSQDAKNVVSTRNLVTDAAAGTLPAVSIVLPSGPQGQTSQHNGLSMTTGDNWIGTVLSDLSNGPEWSSTAVFILYDDCGCFYDHVTPPPGQGLGPRTPLVLASPWAVHGGTYTAVTSTQALLRFIEANFNLSPMGTSDANADNLMGMFDFTQKPALDPLPVRQNPVPATSTQWMKAHTPEPDNT